MFRQLTKDEMIAQYRMALLRYADPVNWAENRFLDPADANNNDCSAYFKQHGELARNALLYNESMTVPIHDCGEDDNG